MNPKFLVVDDDPSCTDILSMMLVGLGCEAVAVHSGQEALQILSDEAQTSQFQAVFLDVMMPDIDGLEVLKRVRNLSHGAELPILLITAMDKSDNVLNGYISGATYYITKPFSQEQVVYGLDTVLGEEEESSSARVFHLDE